MLTHSARSLAIVAALILALPATAPAADAPDSAASTPELIDTDRPDLTDGSSRLDPGVVQLETGWSRTADGSQVSQSFADALVRIGITRAFELRVFTPGVERESFPGVADDSWGEAGAGFKLGKTSADGNRGVAVVADVAVPAEHPGSLTDLQAVLAGDWGSDDFGVSTNLGVHAVASDGGTSSSLLASVSVSRGVTKRVSAFAELAGERHAGAGSDWSRFADAGGSWAVARHLQLDASVGRDLESGGPWTIGAGVSKRW